MYGNKVVNSSLITLKNTEAATRGAEAVTRGVLYKVFLKILQTWQENIGVGVFF